MHMIPNTSKKIFFKLKTEHMIKNVILIRNTGNFCTMPIFCFLFLSLSLSFSLNIYIYIVK